MMVMIMTRWWKWDHGGTLRKVVVIEVAWGGGGYGDDAHDDDRG